MNNNPKLKLYQLEIDEWNIKLKYATFLWSGKYILEYALKHPEQKWIFRPHPLLYKALIDNKVFTPDEAKNYYNEWDKIGIKYEDGNYLELFNKSKLLISDSGSMLGEYFITGKPAIILAAQDSDFNSNENYILETYYCVKDVSELGTLLEKLPEDDYMKEIRMKAIEKFGFKNNNASQKIIHDIIKQIGG